jgi:amino acid transporter
MKSTLESLTPSGDLEQGPYARALIALAIGAVLSNMLSAPAVTASFGIWPFVVTQLALLWFWFSLTAKRLRNAERSILGVTAVALIALIAIVLLSVVLVLQVADLEAGTAAPWRPASIGTLIYPFVFLFNVVTGPSANPQDLTIAVLAAFTVAPLLLMIWWSAWSALQPSELHATEQT